MKIMYFVVSYPGGIQARFERLADAIMYKLLAESREYSFTHEILEEWS